MMKRRPFWAQRFWTRSGRPDGYNLVALAVMVTILNVLVAAALPSWSAIIQREKEEELIFRGLQYAEAIRIFQARNNRLPVRLEELIEVEPRCIRKLWKNPMAEDGAWRLILRTGNQQPGQPGQPGANGQQGENLRPGQRSRIDIVERRRREALERRGQSGAGANGRADSANPGQLSSTPQGESRLAEGRYVPGADLSSIDKLTTGPIAGVASPDGEKAFKNFLGSQEIKEWQFRVELLAGVQLINNQGPMARPVNAATIGRPFPPGVTPQQPGMGQQQGGNGLRPGNQPGRTGVRQPRAGAGQPGNAQQNAGGERADS